jgi:hypothetical protein
MIEWRQTDAIGSEGESKSLITIIVPIIDA